MAQTLTGTVHSFIEPDFPSTQVDPLRNYPIHHPDALVNYYLTKDVLVAGTERGKTPRGQNDVNFALQREISKGQFSNGRKRPFDLVTMDYVNNRDLTAPDATSGLFTTSTDAAGSFVPVGTHAEPSASPSIHSFATAAAHQSGIVIVGLFHIDTLDADGRPGVFALGTAATDHWRVHISPGAQVAQVATRDTSIDTVNASSAALTDDLPASSVVYVSLGARINADDTFQVAVNGNIVLTGTLSADAQAHTGHTVGAYGSGVAPGTGILLFQAIDLKVNG